MILIIKRIFIRILFELHKIYYRIFKPVGIGVRTIIVNKNNEVLLVEHTYKPLLYFPGGGVKRFEELHSTAIRETREEVGLNIMSPKLVGIYRDINHIVNDVLFVYSAKVENNFLVKIDEIEIKSASWYPLDEIPREKMNQRCRIALGDFLIGNVADCLDI